MNKALKYLLRSLIWIIAGVLILVIAIALLIQTRPAKNMIANLTGKYSSLFINGTLELKRIDGNFFSSLIISNISLTGGQDTIAGIDELNIRYNLWSVINNKIEVDQLLIDRPRLFITQDKDSVWNFQKLMKPGSDDGKKGKGVTPEINIAGFIINEGIIITDTPDSIIPRKIQNFNTEINFFWSQDLLNARLNKLSFITYEPDLTLSMLNFEFRQDSGLVHLKDFYLKTSKNQLQGNARLDLPAGETGLASFESAGLDISEFEYFLPELKIPAHPEININADLRNNLLKLNIAMQDKNQSVSFNITTENSSELFSNQDYNNLSYQVKGIIKNIELAYWTGNQGLDYLINGELSATGKGLDPASAVMAIKGNFRNSFAEGRKIDDLIFEINLNNSSLQGFIEGNAGFGNMLVTGEMHDITGQPVYSADIDIKNLDISALTGNDSLPTDINLTANIKGSGFDPDLLKAAASVNLSESSVAGTDINTIQSFVNYRDNNINIESLLIETDSLSVTGKGNYSLKGNSELTLLADFKGIGEFRRYIPVSGLITAGRVEATVRGMPDSLNIYSAIELNNSSFNEILLDRLKVDAEISLDKKDTIINTVINADGITAGNFFIDTLLASISGSTDSLSVNSNLKSEQITAMVNSGITFDEQIRLTLSGLNIDYGNIPWTLENSPAVITVDSTGIDISNLRLAGNRVDTIQYLSLEGHIATIGEENFTLEIANLGAEQFAELIGDDYMISGDLNIKMHLKGTADSPLISMNFNVDSAAFNDYQFSDISGAIEYKDSEAGIKMAVMPADSGQITAEAFIPVKLRLDTAGFHIDPADSIEGRLTVENLSLELLEMMNIPGDKEGYVDGTLTISGTMESPDPEGNISLRDASITAGQYGINYQDIELTVSVSKNKITLDTLYISGSNGYVEGSGLANFGSEILKGKINQSNFKMVFNRFGLLDHPQFNITVDGHAGIEGEDGNLVYGGDLNIPKSEIYLPAVLSMMNKMYVPEIPKPLLVEELEKMTEVKDTVRQSEPEPVPADTIASDFAENLTGNLRIRIPKNMWIKNEDLRAEISGDVELRKNESFFELFGIIEIVRGQYDLLGKTFIIKEGSVIFQGGEEITPRLDINALYTFRNPQRIEQTLSATITGDPEDLKINFTLDEEPVNEGDALSYILFGKSINELSMDEQENMGGEQGPLAGRAAASLLSSQLTNFLGNRLNVDYLEIKSDGSFDNATIEVGKYITNDLFVSYEQHFGETDEINMAKYEVKLEYELFRFLFFVLNNSSDRSGFDVIVKFNVN